VSDLYRVGQDDIYKSKRGKFNEARKAAVFLMWELRRNTLKEIGAQFDIKNIVLSAVSLKAW